MNDPHRFRKHPRGPFAPMESDRVPPPDDRGVLVRPRAARVADEIARAASVLEPKERASMALGFLLASSEALGMGESEIILEIRKAFGARNIRQ